MSYKSIGSNGYRYNIRERNSWYFLGVRITVLSYIYSFLRGKNLSCRIVASTLKIAKKNTDRKLEKRYFAKTETFHFQDSHDSSLARYLRGVYIGVFGAADINNLTWRRRRRRQRRRRRYSNEEWTISFYPFRYIRGTFRTSQPSFHSFKPKLLVNASQIYDNGRNVGHHNNSKRKQVESFE